MCLYGWRCCSGVSCSVALAYFSHATWSLPLERGTHGVVGVSWHGPVCGRGSRGMVVVVHGLGLVDMR